MTPLTADLLPARRAIEWPCRLPPVPAVEWRKRGSAMKEFNDINKALEFLAQETASVRGEALAARALAMLALDWLIAHSSAPAESMQGLEKAIDGLMNTLTFSTEGDDALGEQVREIARLRAHETLDAIRKHRKVCVFSLVLLLHKAGHLLALPEARQGDWQGADRRCSLR